MKRAALIFIFALTTLASAHAATEVPPHIRTLLTQKCVYCHVENAAAKSRFPLTADLNEKVLEKYRDRIDEQISYGTMPPATVPSNLQLTNQDFKNLGQFISTFQAGVIVSGSTPRAPPPPPSPLALNGLLCLAPPVSIPAADRKFFRTISLARIQFKSPADKDLYIQAINKVLNSVSTNKDLATATLTDDGTTLQVDLRKFNLNTPDKTSALDKALGSGVYRADKFITLVSKPPLYNKLLELPRTVAQLKARYLSNRKAPGLFAATTKSGVSSQHRAFSCYQGTYGSFCESYDYLGRKNGGDGGRAIFRDPLKLESNGGEYIFKLPNGMNAYYLSAADGTEKSDDQTSLDVGPIEVVQAPFRRNKAIINGQTCMACHHNGLIPKQDEMRNFATKNFSGAKRDQVLARYAPYETLKKFIDEDNAKTIAAQRAIGVTAAVDPVNELVSRYEDGIRLKKPDCTPSTATPLSPARTPGPRLSNFTSDFLIDFEPGITR